MVVARGGMNGFERLRQASGRRRGKKRLGGSLFYFPCIFLRRAGIAHIRGLGGPFDPGDQSQRLGASRQGNVVG